MSTVRLLDEAKLTPGTLVAVKIPVLTNHKVVGYEWTPYLIVAHNDAHVDGTPWFVVTPAYADWCWMNLTNTNAIILSTFE